MKNFTPKFLVLLLPALSFVHAANVPPIEVIVTDAAGKVAYKSKISANGTFATGNLEPGNYVVQFDSKSKFAKGNKFSISAAAGKNPVGWNSIEGEKLVEPGIAVRIKVEKNSKITGQVAPAAQTTTATQGNTKSKYNGPVKVINGKRYIWITPYTGSVEGGHWAEEGSDEANKAQGISGMRTNQPAATNSMKY